MRRPLPGTLVSAMNHDNELQKCPLLIRQWATKWNALGTTGQITCEWSSRLRRSLGRAYPERMLVRLSLLLREPLYEPLFDEVLCHEVAHVVVFKVHGRGATSHGLEWQTLMRQAGYEPRRSFHTKDLPNRKDRESVRYDHVCPICQSKRTAKRPMPTWRCVACSNVGLRGELIVQSRPEQRNAMNVE
jgi:predicted SprT family Zn-dependent metalloprotease